MRTYFKHTIKNTISIKKIYTIDFFSWEQQDEKSYIHHHPFWEFCYAKKGSISYISEGKECKISSGEAFFLPPEKEHIISNKSQSPAELLIINFKSSSQVLKIFKNFAIKIDEESLIYLSNIINEAQLTFDLKQTDKLTPKEQPILGGEQCIELNLELFIIHVLRKMTQTTSSKIYFKENNKDLIVEEIISLLKENIYTKITIDEICEKMHYSKSYISHVFNEKTGRCIIPYFNELKIEESKKLLTTTSLTVAKITEKLSFTDVNYFNHRFKNQTGMTPIEYKKSVYKNK